MNKLKQKHTKKTSLQFEKHLKQKGVALVCQWNVIPKHSHVAIEDAFGMWIATTRSVFVASTIVELHNRNEPTELPEPADDGWIKENKLSVDQ